MPLSPVFIDRLDLWSVARLALARVRPVSIVYFDGATAPARVVLRVLQRARRLPGVEAAPGSIGEVRGPDGASEYPALFRRARGITAAIRRTHWDGNQCLRELDPHWHASKTALHMERLAEPWVRIECLRIRMARWIALQRGVPKEQPVMLLVARHEWLSHLRAFAAEQGVQLRPYRRWHPVRRDTIRHVWSVGRRLAGAVVRRLRPSHGPTSAPAAPETDAAGARSTRPVVAMHYYHLGLSLDPTRRSELFWLAYAAEPGRTTLVYDYSGPWPLDSQTAAALRARHVQVVPRGMELSAAHGIRAMLRDTVRDTVRYAWYVARAAAKATLNGAPPSPSLVKELLQLAYRVAFWKSFFGAQRVRIHVGSSNTEVAPVLALDALDAVSVAYQYSISFLTVGSTTLLTAGEDVQFVFSSDFATVWDELSPLPRARVQIGYLYDTAIPLLRSSPDVSLLRRRFEEAGAKFVICFFDENSVTTWYVPAPDEDAAHDYRSLAEWVLCDSTLAVIVKTKKGSNLYERVREALPVVQQAKATGRFLITTDEPALSHLYPAEAALVADLAVGKLVGATAAFEASRAGIPTVLIDTEGYRDHPFWTKAGGRIVFSDWSCLRAATAAYRQSAGSDREFGAWRREAEMSDGYLDFGASRRFAQYLEMLAAALERGVTKNEAVSAATAEFRLKWGYHRVTSDEAEPMLWTSPPFRPPTRNLPSASDHAWYPNRPFDP